MLPVIHVSAFAMLDAFNTSVLCVPSHLCKKLEVGKKIVIESEGHVGLVVIDKINVNQISITFKEIQRKLFVELL